MDAEMTWEKPMEEAQARRLSPLVLAYVGDAVYELYIRSLLARRSASVHELHRRCVQWVSAVGQKKLWHAVEETLTDQEASVARRGRNAKGNVPQHVDPATYRCSTSLEALVGYLYLSGQSERVAALLKHGLATIGSDMA